MLKKVSLAAAMTISISGIAVAAPQGGEHSQQGSSSVVAPAPKAMQKAGGQGAQQAPEAKPKQMPSAQAGHHHHSQQHSKQAPMMGGGQQHHKQAGASQVQAPKIDINKAKASTLAMLPGVSSKQAQHIVQYRKKHHEFKSVSDLSKVKGIDKKTMKSIKSFENVLKAGGSKKSGKSNS